MEEAPRSPDQAAADFPPEVDYLVVGAGLAGTVTALKLLETGRGVLVLAGPGGPAGASSSHAALGVVNPITGMRFTPSHHFAEALPAAHDFYRRWETRWNARFWHPAPIHRFFTSEREQLRWTARRRELEGWDYLESDFAETPAAHPWAPYLRNGGVGGGMTLRGGGWLDISRLLELAREEFGRRGVLRETRFSHHDLAQGQGQGGGGLRWRETRVTRQIIFCEGYAGLAGNSRLVELPRRSAKGEVLVIRAPDLPEPALAGIAQRGVFLVPTSTPYLWRAGANYEWADLSDDPTAHGRAAVEAALRRNFAFGWEVAGHLAGVRPILTDKLPVLGVLPGREGYAALNGLASKGALLAPWAAGLLLAHLEHGAPIPPELDVRRNFPL